MAQEFVIKLKDFYKGYAPLAHLNKLTEKGGSGYAAEMKNVDVLGEYLKQGPGLTPLTNGTQAGVVTEAINHILDVAVASGETYGIGTTKLYQITPSTVVSDTDFPHTITGCVRGNSVAHLKGGLYYFYKRAADGAIGAYDLSSAFTDDWETGLTKTDVMPVATKEDIMIFGHGQYVGVYYHDTSVMEKTKLDFGAGHEVADIIFHANQWLIAVNGGIEGANRTYGQIYSYAGGATTNLLSDEVSVGLQRIGFLFPLNGVVYVAYQDLSFPTGFSIGYLAGRKIESLAHVDTAE